MHTPKETQTMQIVKEDYLPMLLKHHTESTLPTNAHAEPWAVLVGSKPIIVHFHMI